MVVADPVVLVVVVSAVVVVLVVLVVDFSDVTTVLLLRLLLWLNLNQWSFHSICSLVGYVTEDPVEVSSDINETGA